MSSSRRFKKEIKAMDKASESVLALKPVTFHYKNDTTNAPQFGLIAEEVADVTPDLVVRDANGEIYTVRYEAVNVAKTFESWYLANIFHNRWLQRKNELHRLR